MNAEERSTEIGLRVLDNDDERVGRIHTALAAFKKVPLLLIHQDFLEEGGGATTLLAAKEVRGTAEFQRTIQVVYRFVGAPYDDKHVDYDPLERKELERVGVLFIGVENGVSGLADWIKAAIKDAWLTASE